MDSLYHAYISYSHIDARFAAWLQRALETWRIPSQLSSSLGFARIKPVFRDRSDLRSSANLGEALNQALEKSTAMVVICSHHSAPHQDQRLYQGRTMAAGRRSAGPDGR